MSKYLQNYKRLLGFVKPHLGLLGAAGALMALSSAFSGASLGIFVPLVDKVLGGKEIITSPNAPQFFQGVIAYVNSLPRLDLLNRLVAAFLTLYILKELTVFLQSNLMSDVSLRIIRDVRNILYEKLLRLSLDFYSRSSAGVLVSRITNDSAIIKESISEGLTDLIYQSFQLLACLAVVVIMTVTFSIKWWLLAATLLIVPLIIWPITKIGRKLKKLSASSQVSVGGLYAKLYETISGITVVKSFSREKDELDKFKSENQRYYSFMIKSVKRLNSISPITELFTIACAVLIVWVGGREVIAGSLSAGAFIAFLTALLSIVRPFKRLSRVHAINQQAMAAAERIFEVLDEHEAVKEVDEAAVLKEFKGEISLEGVSFGYDSREILKGVSLRVKKGEVLAIVGKSGVGKTTFVNFLPRFYDPTKGVIKIDGVDLRGLRLKSLRDKIGIVTQETILFHDTVKANIAYGAPEASLDEIKKAAAIANADKFVEVMPKGYDTVVGDRGFRLSGGEKQRISIARAIIKDPPILILDEATSQLDSESEKTVQEAIERAMKDRTVFVIAHRLSTIKNADKVVVLDKGGIAEAGSHDELMGRGGLYKALYDIQFAAR